MSSEKKHEKMVDLRKAEHSKDTRKIENFREYKTATPFTGVQAPKKKPKG